MMHEVNMTCQIDAQLGAQNRQDRRKYDVRSVVCVDNKGRMQKGYQSTEKQKDLCVCSSKCTCNKMVWSVMKSCRMYIVGQALYSEEPYLEKFDHTLNI